MANPSLYQARQAELDAPAPAARVRALARGYYGGVVREVGDVFAISADTDFGGWMEPVGGEDAKRLAPLMEKTKRARPQPSTANVPPTPAVKIRN